ncbi:Uncharacterised protein [Niallia circulans]|uniref:hypothetical protein n=1 Tax=Niallia circulans TaxID=1397 RepID=UPI00077CAA9F|nr:hypothetical protein [Niallia circulans]MDR4315442.1 hypothetical protein [Niallia circulans]MED3837313.1 hypothetical protein [Niallia circulans]MED4244384.1 hypothetical protein [Niallia circulans]MED4248883.1 hypothetical protein [Niallia circulans]QKH61215.1 hypothetical protein FOC77_11460 [Niallia circulans]
MDNPMLVAIRTLLKETYAGPEENASWYTEAKPGSGLFGTLEKISAEDASIPVNGTTIAAQTDHTRYYLWVANSYLNGEVPSKDWGASWKITTVDKITWAQFTDELQQEYTKLIKKIDSLGSLDKQTSHGLLGALAHSAYHLGSIRQMIKSIKVPNQT